MQTAAGSQTGYQPYVKYRTFFTLCVCTSGLCLCYVNLGEPGPLKYNHQEDITSRWWHREAQKNSKRNLFSIQYVHLLNNIQHSPEKKGHDILQRRLTTYKKCSLPRGGTIMFTVILRQWEAVVKIVLQHQLNSTTMYSSFPKSNKAYKSDSVSSNQDGT